MALSTKASLYPPAEAGGFRLGGFDKRTSFAGEVSQPRLSSVGGNSDSRQYWRFGGGTSQREIVTARLQHIYQLAKGTEHLQQFLNGGHIGIRSIAHHWRMKVGGID